MSASRIGPNSVLQTLEALEHQTNPSMVATLRAKADLPEDWPEGLIPEAWFIRTLIALRAMLGFEAAERVLKEAGEGTARYVAAHRIPAPVKGILGALPGRWALPLLIRAFRQHAWTFAGSGHFSAGGTYPGYIELDGAPTCRPEARSPDPHPHCGFYAAAFEGLLRLAHPGVRVEEVECQALGTGPRCRFKIEIVS